MCSSATIDQSTIDCLLEELQALNSEENAVLFPFHEHTSTASDNVAITSDPTPTVKKQSEQTKRTSTGSFAGWTVKSTPDAPAISWIDQDSGFQYTVQNPKNVGQCLVKLQIFNNGILSHISGVYLSPQTRAFSTVQSLKGQLENLWVNRQTGEPKTNGLVQTAIPLAAWRRTDNINNSGDKKDNVVPDCVTPKVKRKKDKVSTDCATSKTKRSRKGTVQNTQTA